jgi:PAS domain S-box-containing protein
MERDIGRPIQHLSHNLEYPDLVEDARKVLETLTPTHREVKLTNQNWYQMRIQPYRTTDNVIDGVVITFVDVDELRRSQQELAQERDLNAALLDTIGLMVVVADQEGIIQRVNPAAGTMLGIAQEELKSRKLWETLVREGGSREETESARVFREHFRRLVQNREQATVEIVLHDREGQPRSTAWTSTVLQDEEGGVMRVILIGRDVTEERAARERLEASEDRYRQMFEQNRSVKLILDLDEGTVFDANPAAAAFYGYSLEKLREMEYSRLLGEEAADGELERLRQVLRGEGTEFTTRHRLADGSERFVELRPSPLNVNGNTLLYAIVQDVTPRVESQQKLARREKQFRQLFEQSLNGAALLDIIYDEEEVPADVRYRELNEAFESITGFERGELVGKRYTEAFPRAKASPLLDTLLETARTGETGSVRQKSVVTGRELHVTCFRMEPAQLAVLFLPVAETADDGEASSEAEIKDEQ